MGQSDGVRVVSGSARGLSLVAPAGRTTRPTGDRVRQAVHNALESLGAIEDAEVLDLFAGSGAMGIEALSRGAAHATFVETDRAALAALRTNLTRCRVAERATVVAGDATRGRQDHRAAAARPPATLVLADPPYAFDAWAELLATLQASGALADDVLVVAESDRVIAPPPGWATVRERTYGGTVVVFLRPEEPVRPG